MKIYSLLLLSFVMGIALAGESIVEVVQVNNRPAEELQPLLGPLMEPGEQAVANGQNLIVKASPARLGTLIKLIGQLDSPVNNFLITVIQSRDMTAEQLNAGLGGSVGFRGRASAINGRIGGYINQGQSQDNIRDTQTIRALEGETAHIKVGNAYPVATYQVYPGYPGYPQMTQSSQYIEATTGFAVTPRLAGRQVNLDVSPWSDRFNRQGQIETQGAQTTVRANLGEWVEIGGVDESTRNSGNGLTSFNNGSSRNSMKILVKVEVVK